MHFVQFCAQNQIQIYFGTILISKVLWWETKEYDQVLKVLKVETSTVELSLAVQPTFL